MLREKKYICLGVSWAQEIMGGLGMDAKVVWLVVLCVNFKAIF